MKKAFIYPSKIGELGIAEEDGFITHIFFGNSVRPHEFDLEETQLIKKAKKQIDEYLIGQRKVFDLPLNPKGTEFEKQVWSALIKIPFSQTRTYKDIAIAIDNEKACRAVGRANSRNPIGIVVPCHRVIGSSGKLTGYSGGLEIKRFLLELEKKFK